MPGSCFMFSQLVFGHFSASFNLLWLPGWYCLGQLQKQTLGVLGPKLGLLELGGLGSVSPTSSWGLGNEVIPQQELPGWESPAACLEQLRSVVLAGNPVHV